MPGPILHFGAQVMCSHGGQAIPVAPNPRVTVSGMPVAVQASPHAVAGCAMPPPPLGNGPCVMGFWVTGALRVTSMGIPLLLMDSVATCVITGTPLVIVSTQTRATAM